MTGLVVFTFHKCKQKIQYLHQPLNNSDDMRKEHPFIKQLIQFCLLLAVTNTGPI